MLKLKSKIYFFTLSLILFFIAINNFIILRFDETSLVGGSAATYFESLEFLKKISNPIWLLKLINKGYYAFHPPLFPLSSIPIYLFFETSPDVACMTNIFYLMILIFSIYSIGRMLYSPAVGLLAVFLITTYPIIFGLSRWYVNDFAGLSLVTLSIYYLIKSEYVKERKNLILANSFASLSFLVRTSSIYFFIGPLLFRFITIFLKRNSPLRNKIATIILCLIPLLGITSGWLWWTKAKLFRWYASFDMVPRVSHIFEGLKYHFGFAFFNIQLHWFYAIIFLISLPFLIRKQPKQAIFLFIWYLFPLIVISGYRGGSCANLTVSALGAVALISSLGIFYIPWHKFRLFFIILIYTFGIFQYFVISYYPKAIKFYSQMDGLKIELNSDINDYWPNHIGILQSRRFNWGAEKILKIIDRDHGFEAQKGKVLLIYANASTFSQILIQSLDKENPWEINWAEFWGKLLCIFEGKCATNDLETHILNSHYILSYDRENYNWRDIFKDKFYESFVRHREKFQKIGEVNMPNGLVLNVFRNKNLID